MFTHKLQITMPCLLFILLLIPILVAENEKIPELKTQNGKIYLNAIITKISPSEISIMHEFGAARIPMKDLSDDMKIRFGYDPEKAKIHAEALAKADAENEKMLAQADKEQAEINALTAKKLKESEVEKAEVKALIASAKTGIFIVNRYEKDGGLFVYGCSVDGLNAITRMQDMKKKLGKQAPGEWNIVTSGKGTGTIEWAQIDRNYLIIGLPKNQSYIKNSSVGGMFVRAGEAKLSDHSGIQVFRFVGLGKTNDIGYDTIDMDEQR